jgi:hypothetical protein
MRLILYILICSSFFVQLFADNKKPTNSGTPIIKIESTWANSTTENSSNTSANTNSANTITINEDITYFTSNEGLFITLSKPTSNVKLFSLTGEIVWKGNLVQGNFLIPIKQGIYFLRINNKSYKVLRK